MYKITCFAPIEPMQLFEALKGFRVKGNTDIIKWDIDDNYIFNIEPFQNQTSGKNKGYRVYFNRSIEGGMYLFDSSFGWLDNVQIKGVERTLSLDRPKEQYMQLFNEKYELIDSRGLFKNGRVGIVVTDDFINLQIRSTKINLWDCLKEIEKLKEQITPERFNLFSYLDGDIG